MSEKHLKFRYAERKDTALILKFIKELAAYEKMEHEVIATEAVLEEWIFDKKKAEVIFAVVDKEEIGFALFFHNFFYLFGACGALSGRLICKAEIPGKWLWKGNIEKTGSNCSGEGMRAPGMVVSGLE